MKVIRYGYSDPLALVGAFLEEMHGHGVTLVLLGALMCANAKVLPKKAQAMAACFFGTRTLLAEVFGSLNYSQTTDERKVFGTTEVEGVCYVKRSDPSHRLSRGCEAHMPAAEQAVASCAKINT